MQTTTKYQLSQWEATDRILREDFNRDNLAVEAALTALDSAKASQAALNTLGAAVDAKAAQSALNALSAAVNAKAEQSALNALSATVGNKAEQSALNTLSATVNTKASQTSLNTLSSRVDAAPLVKLRDITTTLNANQVDVSMTGVNLADYGYLIIVPKINCSAEYALLRLNGIANYVYYIERDNKNYISVCTAMNYGGYSLIRMMGHGPSVTALTEEIRALDASAYSSSKGGKLQPTAMAPGDLQTLNFIGDGSGTIYAGSRIQIWGVR